MFFIHLQSLCVWVQKFFDLQQNNVSQNKTNYTAIDLIVKNMNLISTNCCNTPKAISNGNGIRARLVFMIRCLQSCVNILIA